MSWAWFALVEDWPRDATAAARARDLEGRDVGVLAAWRRRARPARDARRIDDRAIDPGGAPATVSLVLPPPGAALPFDDPAIQQARRAILAGRPFDVVSTLLTGASAFEGSLLAARGADQLARLRDDPFARVFPARLLDVGGGLLGRVPAPAGPTIERYGSSQPWPWDRFPAADR